MKRFFNTAGPVNQPEHYKIPPLERWDLEEILRLIEEKKYFVLHAPRQTGKTSCLLELQNYLNQKNYYKCLYINVEMAQIVRENILEGMKTILGELAGRAIAVLNDPFLQEHLSIYFREVSPFLLFNKALTDWSSKSSKKILLLIDEIDSLVGDVLISVLRQLRSGYDKRPDHFPASIVLCGVRDIRDYRIHSREQQEIITGGSAFNIKAESLRLGDFTLDDVKSLLKQHQTESGQEILDDSIELIYSLTNGQPWLVNALAQEACFKVAKGDTVIFPRSIELAKENLIKRRDVHLDQLYDKLQEDRVRSVIEPILLNQDSVPSLKEEDILYCIDLGLVQRSKSGMLEIANPIYKEVIPRELTWIIQNGIIQDFNWYINKDTKELNLHMLLENFQNFYRKHSESYLKGMAYKESGPQLILQAFLQRVVNGGGKVEREYGLGRMRTDLYIAWPRGSKNPNNIQEVIVECKVWDGLYLNHSSKVVFEKVLEQTYQYADKVGTKEAHLVLFQKSEKSWDEKIFHDEKIFKDLTIEIWGC